MLPICKYIFAKWTIVNSRLLTTFVFFMLINLIFALLVSQRCLFIIIEREMCRICYLAINRTSLNMHRTPMVKWANARECTGLRGLPQSSLREQEDQIETINMKTTTQVSWLRISFKLLYRLNWNESPLVPVVSVQTTPSHTTNAKASSAVLISN